MSEPREPTPESRALLRKAVRLESVGDFEWARGEALIPYYDVELALPAIEAAARADALAEIRTKVARMAEAPSDLSAESLFRRDGWADVLALLDPPK